VKPEEDWVRAQLWTGCAVFHWACFITLTNEHHKTGTGQATWKDKPLAEVPIEK
jgi:hypothetical protein